MWEPTDEQIEAMTPKERRDLIVRLERPLVDFVHGIERGTRWRGLRRVWSRWCWPIRRWRASVARGRPSTHPKPWGDQSTVPAPDALGELPGTLATQLQFQLSQTRKHPGGIRAVVFEVSMLSHSDRKTIPRLPSSRIVVTAETDNYCWRGYVLCLYQTCVSRNRAHLRHMWIGLPASKHSAGEVLTQGGTAVASSRHPPAPTYVLDNWRSRRANSGACSGRTPTPTT
jgi:hypothetical protein